MFPRTRTSAQRHQQKKRQREIELIVGTLRDFLKSHPAFGSSEFRILEFGCGHGYQIPYLKSFGTLVASDIRRYSGMDRFPEVEFRECAIQHTPFEDSSFDLIFSNHVMQYIPEAELPEFYRELKRIGKPGSYYAFSVPTSLWLTLAIPAQYYEKFLTLFRKRPVVASTDAPAKHKPPDARREGSSLAKKMQRGILPQGSGSYHPYTFARPRFHTRSWISRLEAVGFQLVKQEPLLLYSPSEWPVVPTSRFPARHGFASSVLLVFRTST